MYQKTIPADTPSYEQDTKKEKSALDGFAIKTRLVLVCLMEQKLIRDKKKTIFKQDKSYSHSLTYIHVEATDVKEILTKMIIKILKKNCYLLKEW